MCTEAIGVRDPDLSTRSVTRVTVANAWIPCRRLNRGRRRVLLDCSSTTSHGDSRQKADYPSTEIHTVGTSLMIKSSGGAASRHQPGCPPPPAIAPPAHTVFPLRPSTRINSKTLLCPKVSSGAPDPVAGFTRTQQMQSSFGPHDAQCTRANLSSLTSPISGFDRCPRARADDAVMASDRHAARGADKQERGGSGAAYQEKRQGAVMAEPRGAHKDTTDHIGGDLRTSLARITSPTRAREAATLRRRSA